MRAALVVLILAGSACGTLAGEGAGDENLPSTGLGPWRALEQGEVSLAPLVSGTRTAAGGPEVVALDDGTFALYRGDASGAIVRETSADGLSFTGAEPALEPADAWEGDALSDPCLLRDGSRWLLYYEAGEGIGVARGDGTTFERAADGPVLAPGVAWEGGRVGAPSVVRDERGGFLLYYEAAGGVGLAASGDAVAFVRIGDGPVVAPGPAGAWDDRAVLDPAARVHVSPTGRSSIHLFYLGVAAAPADVEPPWGVGVAATFDGRAPSRLDENPVFEHPAAMVGLGHPIDVGPALLLPFSLDRSPGSGVGAAVWPPEVRFGEQDR